QERTDAIDIGQDAAGAVRSGLRQAAAPECRRVMIAVRILVVAATVSFVEEQPAEPRLVEVPVAHRSGVDMEEAGTRVPADAALFHRPRGPHRVAEPGPEMDVERPTVKVLAVLGDPEGG